MARELTPLEVLDSFPSHEETLSSLLSSRVRQTPARPLLSGEIPHWTYLAAQQAAASLAGALHDRGVAHGDRVAMVSHNSDLGPLVLLALGRLGAIFVPVNPALTPSEMSYVLGHCEPRLVIAQQEDLPHVREVVAGLDLAAVVIGTATLDASARQATPATALDGLPSPTPHDPLVMIYTSGTTGFPKGVVHSHRNFVLAAEAFVERLHLQPGERLMAVLPFFHLNALFYSFGGALACGGTLISMPRFSASRFWDVATEHGATQLNILAAVGNILAKRPRGEYNAAHRIRKIYGGPITAEMMNAFQNEFNVPDLVEGFGMSEIPGALNNPFEGPRKVGSIGKPARHPRFPGVFAEAKVVGDDGNQLPAGHTGELLVRTPISMLCYFKDPEQTAAAHDGKWLRTGDLAKCDDDGYFYFVARKKDIIRRRGENISGAELDRVVGSHPDVMEAAAFGVPAPLGDEDIAVAVVARSSPAPTPEAIVEWCAARLSAMKLPRYIVFVDSLPHTPSQRVTKHVLKNDEALLADAWDREATESRQ